MLPPVSNNGVAHTRGPAARYPPTFTPTPQRRPASLQALSAAASEPSADVAEHRRQAERIAYLERELRREQAHNAKVEAALAEVQREVAELAAAAPIAVENAETVAALEEHVTLKQVQVASLERRVAVMAAENTELQGCLDTARGTESALTAELRREQQRASDHGGEAQTAHSAAAAAKARLEEAVQDGVAAERRAERLEREVDALRHQLQDAAGAAERSAAEAAQRDAANARAHGEAAAALEALRAEADRAHAEAAEQRRLAQAAQQAAQRHGESHAAVLQEAAALRQELREAHAVVDALRRERTEAEHARIRAAVNATSRATSAAPEGNEAPTHGDPQPPPLSPVRSPRRGAAVVRSPQRSLLRTGADASPGRSAVARIDAALQRVREAGAA